MKSPRNLQMPCRHELYSKFLGRSKKLHYTRWPKEVQYWHNWCAPRNSVPWKSWKAVCKLQQHT